MQRITVVHLITELDTGGAEQMLYKLVSRMNRDRFRCIVVSMTNQGKIGPKVVASGIPLVALGMGRGRPTLKGLTTLYHLLKQESVNIIQTWLYHADLLGFIVGRLAEVGKVIWGIRCSDMHLKEYRPMTALTVRLCGVMSSLVDAIVVNSEEGRRIHRNRGYITERMFLFPNGFDTKQYCADETAKDWLRDLLGLRKDDLMIGLVARFDPMKGHRNFLKAALHASQRNNRVHFVMAGKGMVPQNEHLASFIDQRIKKRIHLMGLRDDIPRIMAGLDIASSASAFGEGFSNTIGEAMSCGTPCVVTDVGDSAKIVGDTGIVVPPRDPEALSDAWLKILEMGEEERRTLGAKARQRIQENFELGSIVRRFEDFYESIYQL